LLSEFESELFASSPSEHAAKNNSDKTINAKNNDLNNFISCPP
jgi:hypothetical protein